jgi:hypothetical protein
MQRQSAVANSNKLKDFVGLSRKAAPLETGLVARHLQIQTGFIMKINQGKNSESEK